MEILLAQTAYPKGVISLRLYRSAGLILALAASVVALLIVPSSSASAYGCTFGNPYYGPPQYCVYISGSGTWVNSVTGNFGGGTEVRAWYITAEFFTSNWAWYKTYNGPYHGTCCDAGGGNVININAYMRAGYMCSTLNYVSVLTNSWRKMSVCHRVG